MTITTAKLVRAIRLAWMPPLAAFAFVATPAAQAQQRGGWEFTPTLDLRETYTDNVALDTDLLAKSQFVSEITPGFLLSHKGPRLTLRGRYQFQYFSMQDKDVSGTNRSARAFQADAKAQLVEDVFYLDASGSKSMQGISPFGPQASTSTFSTLNRAEITTWRISPYLLHRVGSLARAELRYTRDSVAGDRTGLNDTDSNTVMFNVNSGAAFRTIGWGANLQHQEIKAKLDRNYTSDTAKMTVRYLATNALTLNAGVGYDKYDYTALGGQTKGAAWNVGLNWSPSKRTGVTASTGRRYYGPSHAFSAVHRSRRTVWNIDYSDDVNTSRGNFLLPQTVDTAAMLDRLFTASFADPVERAAAVQAYIRDNNLPEALDNSINFFSNRYSLQRRLKLSAAFRASRSSAILNVYHARRDALSIREIDGPLIGSNLQTLNDNITQQGLSLILNYRLGKRTSLNLSDDFSNTESRSTGIKGTNKIVRLSLRHTLPGGTVASLEARRIQGSFPVQNSRSYRENAIVAALSLQL